MARLGASLESDQSPTISTRRQFATIAWLRWRIFVNSLRGKGAAGELVVKIISYPFLAIVILGPSVGAAVGSYYLVNSDQVSLLAIPLWIIFALWQFIGVNTSTTGLTFDLSSLIRFPIRYRDYLLIRLSFGLMDPPTLAGIGCLIGMSIGIAIASPWLLSWAAPALFVYGLCNILFSRMIYSWMERWLAQRRTRELLTGIILAFSLGVQFVAQYAQRLGHPGRHSLPNPILTKTMNAMVFINWLLPPGLTALSIDHFHSGESLMALAALSGVLLFTIGFLLVLHLRLRAQFLGEDLSEAPAAPRPKSVTVKQQAAIDSPSASASLSFLPATVAGCLIKEVRYLLRSGPKVYALIMPVFVVFLISMRSSAFTYPGISRHSVTSMLFSYGCAYTQLIFVSLIYNSLGADGTGVQFYFMAPVRMRDVILAKNLMTVGIFAIEIILIYIAAAIITKPTAADLTVATIAWSLFTLFLNMSIGNIRSLASPKVLDSAKVRSQNVSGLSSLISLVVVAAAVGLGVLMALACNFLHTSYWMAAAVFSVLAILAVVVYLLVLNKMDGIASDHIEDLTRALAKV
jgi:ABC-2 type transport system permease protein